MKKHSLSDIIDRLASQFPDIDHVQIQQIVTECHADLVRSPVQDYVGILVERAAREQLAHLLPRALLLSDARFSPTPPRVATPTLPVAPSTPAPRKPRFPRTRHPGWFRSAFGDGTAWLVL